MHCPPISLFAPPTPTASSVSRQAAVRRSQLAPCLPAGDDLDGTERQPPRTRRARPYAVPRWHEAERRVGAPARRHRLRLLRQVGDQLVPGVEQFLFVDDVVAVEDGTALVPGQEHGDALGDAGADQVTGGGAAAIVEEAGRHPSGLARGAPRRAPAADGDAVAVEDERAGGVAACPPSVQRVGDGGRDRENPPDQRLRAGGRESRMTPPALSISSQLRPRISCLRQPE